MVDMIVLDVIGVLLSAHVVRLLYHSWLDRRRRKMRPLRLYYALPGRPSVREAALSLQKRGMLSDMDAPLLVELTGQPLPVVFSVLDEMRSEAKQQEQEQA